MSRYIFVTGGVVSSIGKGIFSAALGALLKTHGLTVNAIKLDPYLNIDPGTMNPYQHGEVFVTRDGAETDLDIGHYERFLGISLTRNNSCTAGQIYETVLQKERDGYYQGKTVQVIPHVTDEICARIVQDDNNSDITIVEIGGTIGDIESLPFLEAIRQLRIRKGSAHTLFAHVTFVPFITPANELKTKPSQHSVKEMRSIGLQPDILICRSQNEINIETRRKIALFTNVDEQAVFSLPDADNIYSIPLQLHKQDVSTFIATQFDLSLPQADMQQWQKTVALIKEPTSTVDIALIGKYTDLVDAYISVNQALQHAGIHSAVRVRIHHIEAEVIEQQGVSLLQSMNAILIPGGFGERGVEGKIVAVHYARENNLPFLGICLGMQIAVIEFARNVVGLTQAASTEFAPDSQYPVIALLEEWRDMDGKMQQRTDRTPVGGTMRLGEQACHLKHGSKIQSIYNREMINERHRHRYEVNNRYVEQLTESGLQFSGWSDDEESLAEVIEITDHQWFIGCQFHPEFTSTVQRGHPLFNGFVNAAIEARNGQ